MTDHIITMDKLADIIVRRVKIDKWVLICSDGEMGEGKSCAITQLGRKVADKLNTPFSYKNNITYLRSELLDWIEKKPEYSVIIIDELISLFYNRNWNDSDQKENIELFNKIRDRHLVILGCVPMFWHTDKQLRDLTNLYINISQRGTANIFTKEVNCFNTDAWNQKQNMKLYRQFRSPHKCIGFMGSMPFSDWNSKDKKEYYEVRNTKRKDTEGQTNKFKHKNNVTTYQQRVKILIQRYCHDIDNRELAKALGFHYEHIGRLKREETEQDIGAT